MSDASALFLDASRKTLATWLERIDKCLDQLTPEQVWWREHQTNNAAGNLVLHLCGNVRQWIISGVGGALDVRDRDAEFDQPGPLPKEQLLEKLRATVAEADAVLAAVTPGQLSERRRIQVYYDVTVLEAIHHVTEHFAMHAGQILFATKLLTGRDLGFYRRLSKQRQEAPAPGTR